MPTDKLTDMIDDVIKQLEVEKLAMVSATTVDGWVYKFNNPKARKGKYYKTELQKREDELK